MSNEVRNLIYPPVMDTYQASNCIQQPMIIKYTMPEYNIQYLNNIKSVHISLTNQSNNASVLKGGSSVKILSWTKNNGDTSFHEYSNKIGTITISPNDIIQESGVTNSVFKNTLYKVQIRFDFGEIGTSELSTYLNENKDKFSEWSTVSLIKPIKKPKLSIIGIEKTGTSSMYKKINNELTGWLIFDSDETDSLKSYSIKINNIQHDEIIADKLNTIEDSFDLSNENSGTGELVIKYSTVNGYNNEESFSINIESELNHPTITENEQEYNNPIAEIKTILLNDEYGYNDIIIKVNTQQNTSTHTCEFFRSVDNKNWIKIGEKDFTNSQSQTFEYSIRDNLIKSGMLYYYAIQVKSSNNVNVYKPIIRISQINNFYSATFTRKNQTLKTTFDFTISQYSKKAGRSLTETLGGKYPRFTKNGKLNYKQFSISGKISIEDNLDEYFISIEDLLGEKLYEKICPWACEHNNKTYQHNELPQSSMIMIEREFREKVYDWLNDGNPKLFKSGPEGNMIVMLDGITMSPEKSIGRLIYNFSGTMYEIADVNDYSNLTSLGII